MEIVYFDKSLTGERESGAVKRFFVHSVVDEPSCEMWRHRTKDLSVYIFDRLNRESNNGLRQALLSSCNARPSHFLF